MTTSQSVYRSKVYFCFDWEGSCYGMQIASHEDGGVQNGRVENKLSLRHKGQQYLCVNFLTYYNVPDNN